MWGCELVTSGGRVNFGICFKQRLSAWNWLSFMSQVKLVEISTARWCFGLEFLGKQNEKRAV